MRAKDLIKEWNNSIIVKVSFFFVFFEIQFFTKFCCLRVFALELIVFTSALVVKDF